MILQWTYVILSTTIVSCMLNVLPHSASAAPEASVTQYIAPLECGVDSVNNGVNVQIILTPQECEDHIDPQAPDTSSAGNKLDRKPGLNQYQYQFLMKDTVFFNQFQPVDSSDMNSVKVRYSHDERRASTYMYFFLLIILIVLFSAIYLGATYYKNRKR